MNLLTIGEEEKENLYKILQDFLHDAYIRHLLNATVINIIRSNSFAVAATPLAPIPNITWIKSGPIHQQTIAINNQSIEEYTLILNTRARIDTMKIFSIC